MKKEYSYVPGKVDGNDTGVKNCEVEITWKYDGHKFSMSGNVWNPRKTDIVSGGQCIDEIAELFPLDSQVQSMHKIWKRWHLNDMQAGSPAQEAFLQTVTRPEGTPHYEWAGALLKEAGLNPDPNYLVPKTVVTDDGVATVTQVPYKYGSQWLTQEIPEDVKETINSWHQTKVEQEDVFMKYLESLFTYSIIYRGVEGKDNWESDLYELMIDRNFIDDKTGKYGHHEVRFNYSAGFGHRKNKLGKTWTEKSEIADKGWKGLHKFDPKKSAPSLKTVLDSIIGDIKVVTDYPDFLDFAEELGYEDPKKARRVWAACDESREKLKKLAGIHYYNIMNKDFTGEKNDN